MRSLRIPGLIPGSSDTLEIGSFIVEVDFSWANFQSMTSFTDRNIEALVEFPAETRDLIDFAFGGSIAAADHPRCSLSPLCPGFVGFLTSAIRTFFLRQARLQSAAALQQSRQVRPPVAGSSRPHAQSPRARFCFLTSRP